MESGVKAITDLEVQALRRVAGNFRLEVEAFRYVLDYNKAALPTVVFDSFDTTLLVFGNLAAELARLLE